MSIIKSVNSLITTIVGVIYLMYCVFSFTIQTRCHVGYSDEVLLLSIKLILFAGSGFYVICMLWLVEKIPVKLFSNQERLDWFKSALEPFIKVLEPLKKSWNPVKKALEPTRKNIIRSLRFILILGSVLVIVIIACFFKKYPLVGLNLFVVPVLFKIFGSDRRIIVLSLLSGFYMSLSFILY